MIRQQHANNFDWITTGIYFSLLIIGWLSIYSVTYSQNINRDIFDLSVPITKQSVYIFIALLVFGLSQWVDDKFWHTFAYIIYGLGLLLLLLVLIFGTEIKGAKAWFNIGGFSFQPSEIAKFGTALALSSYLTYFKTDLKFFNYQLISFAIIFAPVLLILLQPDAGSAITFFSFFLLLFLEGLNEFYYLVFILLFTIFIFSFLFPISYVLLGLILLAILISWIYFKHFRFQWLIFALVFIGLIVANFYFPIYQVILAAISLLIISLIYVWKSKAERVSLLLLFGIAILSLFSYTTINFFNTLEPHQQERIKVWLKPSECDPRGSLYNILQSKVAIGAGGFMGSGYLNGNMTKLKFVPEQSTDFIFSSIGEEQGFIGSLTVIVLFFVLIFRIVLMSEHSEKKFFSNFAICVAGLFFIHVLINIGMTMGLVPIIGIPLPFISKGGSALIGFSLMLGVLLRMKRKG
ncbi:MAG: rod shape-determining protein RodA [Saprospiraceae bacterium]|nr:rod shape-determining protein RodA [Saprospiraceae bacterium]MBK8450987.1 rod shape-determining protein RodA [Saprospiraceae bacterium]MBK9222940.1 rod shape-determining protein RodA [Saprospiraceae bacterium]MBK9720018.1 rod shape-determining protein RodA [Saprospiraceae bacterium]